VTAEQQRGSWFEIDSMLLLKKRVAAYRLVGITFHKTVKPKKDMFKKGKLNVV
jgi:hypothetical protein